MEFTPAQLALIDVNESTFLEACPGGGKTQSIIERFVSRLREDPRRGVGLISFTNAVIDEAHARGVSQPGLLATPNFIGTIDAFINRFIVRPRFTIERCVVPRFFSHWGQVPGSSVRVAGIQGEYRLDWFKIALSGQTVLSAGSVPTDQRYLVSNLASWQVTRLEAEAKRRWLNYTRQGILDAAASRAFMTDYLANPDYRRQLVDLLGHRFSEIIIDEVQDCCDEDVALLDLILEAGVRLVAVGDPHQAIFGFRGASSGRLHGLTARLDQAGRLNDNFRSSPSICALVSSLRSSDRVDRSAGDTSSEQLPVMVLPYARESQIADSVVGLAGQLGVPNKEVVVLAHSTSVARRSAGAGAQPKNSSSNLVELARTVGQLQDSLSSRRIQAEALGHLQRLLKHLASDSLAAVDEVAFFAAIGMSERQYSELCLRVARTLPSPRAVKPSEFQAAVLGRSELAVLGLTARRLARLKSDDWAGTLDAVPEGRIAYSTIHSFKGLQRSMAVVVVPPRKAGTPDEDDGVACWTAGLEGEARNVLYVGVSRPRRVATIAVHNSRLSEVESNLTRDGVPYQVVAS